MRASRSISNVLALALATAACAALLWFSVPRLVAALLAVPGDRAAFALTFGPSPSDRALQALIDSRASASRWTGDPAYGREAALAALNLARRAGFQTGEGRAHLQAAEEQAVAALAKAPADPETWARLAEVRYHAGADLDLVMDAYRNSILTGLHAPHLAAQRIRLGFALWPRLSAEHRRLVTGQVRSLAATQQRRSLDRLAHIGDSKRNHTLIVLALLQHPDWVKAYTERRVALNIQPSIP